MSVAVRLAGLLLAVPVFATGGRAADAPVPVPGPLPRYHVDLRITPDQNLVEFTQRVVWTNPAGRPTKSFTFNFYPNYEIPSGDRQLLAKTLELLRLAPSYGIDPAGRHGRVTRVNICSGDAAGPALAYSYREDNPTSLVVELPAPVGPGESVAIEMAGTIRLPNKQGRWGRWDGITFLTNALPVVAYYDDRGWHDTPFVPWHQPFWTEAGVYTASITLPADHKLACSAAVAGETAVGGGFKRIDTRPFVGRDFAVLCSAEYEEFRTTVRVPDGRDITLKCLAYPRHEFYAREMLRFVAEALPVYCEWFGPFPYDQFTIAESFFGWNGNECAGLVMIDERVFNMPHLARGYVEYLVSHETSHQWWYNQVGTNGYAETFIDEGAAVHFTHKLLDRKHGRDNELLEWPRGLGFLPNIKRENYRYPGWYGAVRRGVAPPAAGPLPEFGNLAYLFYGAYDRGSKVYSMIEARLGPDFVPFIRGLVHSYSFRVISADALKAELIAYTGPASAASWDKFFAEWVYGDKLTDWSVDDVRVDGRRPRKRLSADPLDVGATAGRRVEVVVSQRGELDEPTVLAFQLAEGDGYPVRIPIGPAGAPRQLPELDAEVLPLGDGRVLVRATLPAEPVQVAIDPDRVLPDSQPANNFWRRPPRVRAGLYTFLNETDLTNNWDRWNLRAGLWFWGALYQDPWYTRSSMLGARVGAYRTQHFVGGGYVAARTDYRDVVAGVDGVIQHWPLPKTEVGFNYERRIGGPYGGTSGRDTAERGVVYGRYVGQQTSSLYLYPTSYAEVFASFSDNFLPFARTASPGAVRPGRTWLGGVHYRLNLYTPYWDPERGVWADVVAAGGSTDLGDDVGTGQVRAELAAARKLPDGLGYWSQVRVAGRAAGMAATPSRGQFFALGGGTLFRGFDLAERQGSALWVANGEVRLPVVRDLELDVLDHLVGVRNVYVAGFYDVGAVYADGRQVGNVAHAVGAGLRVDLAFFSFLERATVRLDAAKTVNAGTPWQFWFGVQHPF